MEEMIDMKNKIKKFIGESCFYIGALAAFSICLLLGSASSEASSLFGYYNLYNSKVVC